MSDRGLEMTGEQLGRLESGTDMAADKGIKDSLVMIDDMAFIVNVPSRTVITALEAGNENVFTNINGAVIA
jgi:flagellar operon protein